MVSRHKLAIFWWTCFTYWCVSYSTVTSNNRGTYVWPRTVAGVRVELGCAGPVPSVPSHHSYQRGSLKVPSKSSISSGLYSSLVGTAQIRSVRPHLASHMCSPDGAWQQLDTSQCPFASETTKILEQFASTNLFARKTNLVDSTRSLCNFTRDGKVLRDAMDLVFLAKTVEQYTGLLAALSGPKETAATLVDIISASMAAPRGNYL